MLNGKWPLSTAEENANTAAAAANTAANTAAAATATAKADAKVSVANAAAYPVKGQIAPSDAVVKMPNNRPTICTADDQNCVSIVSRVHFDAGGFDFPPHTPAAPPPRL